MAAATRVVLADKKLAQRQAARHSDAKAAEAWAYFDEVPEIHQAIHFLGNGLSKLRLFAAVRLTPDADPIPIDNEESDVPPDLQEAAKAELARLGNTAGLLRRLNMNLEVPGEAYLVGRDAVLPDENDKGGRAEEWKVYSTSEVRAKNGVYSIYSGPDDRKGEALDPASSTVIRFWLEHPEWANLPDSAMRGVLGECKVLQILSQQVLAQAMRAASAGFLTVPNELSFGPADPTQGEDGREAEKDPLEELFATVLVDPIEDPSAPSSVQPGFIRGQAEYLQQKYLHRILLHDPSMDDSLEKRIAARVRRIARGMNLPVELIEGLDATTFANARQIDQDTFEDFYEPRCVIVCDLFSMGYQRPNLIDAGYDPAQVARVLTWYDPSALVAKQDTEKNAPQAHDRFLISDEAGRQALGFSEDDAPDAVEVLVRAALKRGVLGGTVTASLLEALATEAGVTLPNPASIAVDPGTNAETQALAQLLMLADQRKAARRNGHKPKALAASAASPDYGRQLMEIDRELRTRLLVAANAAMDRALERAGNRLRSKATDMRSVLASVPARSVAATLGPTLALRAASTEETLAGAWDDLADDFDVWTLAAQEAALGVIASLLPAGLSVLRRAGLAERQADDRRSAWEWAQAALTALAAVRMFDPAVEPETGELDPTLTVPPSLVRQAVARAGGAEGLTEVAVLGGVTLLRADGGTRPAGGVGTGELVLGLLRDEGALVSGWTWDYGPALRLRAFQPHQALHGRTFASHDDEELRSDEEFGLSYYEVGDHEGCQCSESPAIVPPAS